LDDHHVLAHGHGADLPTAGVRGRPEAAQISRDVPALDRCDLEVGDKFWSHFLYDLLPNGLSTLMGVNRLKRLISKYRKNWTDYEKGISERALPTLKQGAVSHMCSIPSGDQD
jgi:hypothetical protein